MGPHQVNPRAVLTMIQNSLADTSERMRKKILFKVSGGASIGMGHIKRSIDLAGCLKERKGAAVFFHCNDVERNITRNEYDIPFYFTPADQDDRHFILEFIIRNDIDIVFFDEVTVDEALCISIKECRPGIRIVALDHFEYSSPHIDIIINLFNQNLNVPDPSRVFHGCYAEGVRYAIIRDSFVRAGARRVPLPGEPPRLVLSFGGSDVRGHTLQILSLLSKCDIAFRTTVILGPMVKNLEKIYSAAGRIQNCHVIVNPPDYAEQIAAADLGFIGGGTTMMEFCAAGVPVIVLPQNSAEMRFASHFETVNAVVILKEEFSKEEKISLIKRIMQDGEMKKQMIIAQKKFIDSKGKDRISELVLRGLD